MRRRFLARRLAGPMAGLLSSAACASLPAPPASDAERIALRAEAEAFLARGAASWNRGDLDAFIDDYEPGAATTYIGSRGILRGPADIRAAYAPRFARGGVRDSLSFQVRDVDPLAPDIVNLIATYTLTRALGGRDSITARGPTSLVLRRWGGRWRIVHDHSS